MGVFGERLRSARERAGLSLGQVFEYEGIQKGHLSEMEQGTKNPTGQTIARLALRYHTSADYLLGLTDDPSPRSEGPMPAPVRELLDLARYLSPSRQDELLAHARVELDAHERDVKSHQVNDMLDMVETIGGADAVKSLLEILRVSRTDPAAAERAMDSFFAHRDVGQRPAVRSGNQPVQKTTDQT